MGEVDIEWWRVRGELLLMSTKEDNKQQSKHTRNYRFKMLE